MRLNLISDFHNDFPTCSRFLRLLERYSQGRNEIVGAVFKGDRSYETCYSAAKKLAEAESGNVFLAYEDFFYFFSFKKLEKLLDFNPVYVTLTWNGENALGGGAGCDEPLTKRGKEVIKLLNERKVAVDLAHLGNASFYEAYELADTVVCSHTAFSPINEHKRNLDDDKLSLLNARRALVGLAFYPYFLNGTSHSTVEDVYRHIDFFVDKFGDETLCIGSDFFGCEVYPERMHDYSCEAVLRKKLYSAGYSLGSVDKILYKNLSRFLALKS